MKKRALVLIALLLVFLGPPWRAAPTGQRGPTLSQDLLIPAAGHGTHRVIVQADGATLAGLRVRLGGHLRRALSQSVVLDVSDAELDALSREPGVLHISGDLPVRAGSAITNQVTEASTVWQGTRTLLSSTRGYTGTGVGVAIVDSGIALHGALSDRTIVHVNFVSTEPGVTGDPYGHGTHVAAIVAGNTSAALRVTPEFAGGSAPAAQLIDVRVLDSQGVGRTSDVIAGLDWAVANRAKYNIRVINLSLGHAVTEPSSVDPLCQAVARAVASGITVVVAAGNYGQTADGAPILGGITSPGNSPFALTVGALDDRDTLDRGDDVVASYSSRGPTAYDFAVKPDVVAPGSRIVSAEAYGSNLITTYPQFHVAGGGTNAYMRLSGTSMATAVVSGGAALLLNAHPSLSPAQVKMAIQMGARFLPAAGLNGAGAGSVDFVQAMKVAQSGLVPNLLTTLGNILGTGTGVSFRDDGTLTDRIYAGTGLKLLGLLDLSPLFQTADQAEWGVLHLLGVGNLLAGVPANHLVWGDVASWTSSYVFVWGAAIQSPTGQVVVWGANDTTDGEVFVWGASSGGVQ